MSSMKMQLDRGSFNNYVDQILPNLTPTPIELWTFYTWSLSRDQAWTFCWPPPFLSHVEWPLIMVFIFMEKKKFLTYSLPFAYPTIFWLCWGYHSVKIGACAIVNIFSIVFHVEKYVTIVTSIIFKLVKSLKLKSEH